MEYDYYIGLDWSQRVMAVSRLGKTGEVAKTQESESSVRELKAYLAGLKGKKILTLEESTASQWLYVELRDWVDELIVCDPYRNRLLSEGPKTDRQDAEKLCRLLRAGMVKSVFHTTDAFIEIRKLVSGYNDLVQAGVRLQNQRSALFQSKGMSADGETLESAADQFVLEGLDDGIKRYEDETKRYKKEFAELSKKYRFIRALQTIPGFGVVNATKFAAIVVDPKRFKTRSGFLSYSGLIQLEKMSGGRSYGKKKSRYNRAMKAVIKSAAITALAGNNPFRNQYEFLLKEKNYAPHNARNAVARTIAAVALAIMQTQKDFDAGRFKCSQTSKNSIGIS
jgi:transposase